LPEIIDVQPGGNIFLYGREYGLIVVKQVDGEGTVEENEFYCTLPNRDRIIQSLRNEVDSFAKMA
jgi:hypothetical protein